MSYKVDNGVDKIREIRYNEDKDQYEWVMKSAQSGRVLRVIMTDDSQRGIEMKVKGYLEQEGN